MGGNLPDRRQPVDGPWRQYLLSVGQLIYIAIQLWRNRGSAISATAIFVVGTWLWALWEAGADGSALLPRVTDRRLRAIDSANGKEVWSSGAAGVRAGDPAYLSCAAEWPGYRLGRVQ